MSTYTEAEERRALGSLLKAIEISDKRDADDAAQLVWARWYRFEIKQAPHGRCPHCTEPLDYEPDSLEPYEYAGAKGTHILRGGFSCPECCIPIDEDEIVRVA